MIRGAGINKVDHLRACVERGASGFGSVPAVIPYHPEPCGSVSRDPDTEQVTYISRVAG